MRIQYTVSAFQAIFVRASESGQAARDKDKDKDFAIISLTFSMVVSC